MLEFSEVMREEDPSSAASTDGPKEPYNLPEDPQAEESIALEGYSTDDLIDAAFQGIDLVTYKGDYLSRTLLASSINSAIAILQHILAVLSRCSIVSSDANVLNFSNNCFAFSFGVIFVFILIIIYCSRLLHHFFLFDCELSELNRKLFAF